MRTTRSLLLVAFSLCVTLPASAKVTYVVRADCARISPCYTQIQSALDAAEADNSGHPVIIDVGAGIFREKISIRRARLTLRGRGANKTFVRHALAAEHARAFHRDNWGTPGSATLTIDAVDVAVQGMTIENDFDYLANDALVDGDPQKIGNPQAVALLLDVHSDRVLIDSASLVGFQDTLFANGGRAYVRNSLISGTIDFVFGNGQLLIEHSELRSRRRARQVAVGTFVSYILAPSTPLSQSFGIVVAKSRLTREDAVPDGSVALARPWHPTRKFPDGRYADPDAVGMAMFIDCLMDAHIHSDHWTSMEGTARDGTKTAVFRPQGARFMERGSIGPGARRSDIGMPWQPPEGWPSMRNKFFVGWDLAGNR
jgi:pectinesterase